MSGRNGRHAQGARAGKWHPFYWLGRSCSRLWELYRNCLEANILLRPWMPRKSAPPPRESNESFAERVCALLPEATSSPKSGIGLAVTATVAAFVVTGYWFRVEFDIGAQGHVIITGANETTRQALSDGSVVSVRALSTLTVDETGPQRVARLDAGEIIFKVRATPVRPFIVETICATATIAEDATLRVAIGRTVEFEVYEGVVKVVARAKNGSAPALWLRKGESFSVPVVDMTPVLANLSDSVTTSGRANIGGEIS
jgi:ferric-dicitrate binding protein FerR (iron transport regulator)